MYWNHYSRERAAQEIVVIAHELSHQAYVFSPIECWISLGASHRLKAVRRQLLQLGYTNDCSSLSAISSALTLLDSISGLDSLPYPTALKAAQSLLSAVEFLSSSSSPFPVPNRHLPPELLHHIYGFVVHEHPEPANRYWDREPMLSSRQSTIVALSSTSKLWRRIVLDRPVVYLDTFNKIKKYWAFRRTCTPFPFRRYPPWEEFHIELDAEQMGEDQAGSGWDSLCKFMESGMASNREGKLVISLDVSETALSLSGTYGWGWRVDDWSQRWNHAEVRLDGLSNGDYQALWEVLHHFRLGDGDERQYFIGTLGAPTCLTSAAAQSILDAVEDSWEARNDWEVWCPIFTNYAVFAVPWLVFTAPIFLLRTAPEEFRPDSLPPSRLRHLELSFEVDPSDPAQAIQHLESFFSAISPKIERLAFRLRITCPHPSPADELKFSEQLASCLVACPRLRHLEIGGFGFSPDFLSRLSVLPLSTLALRPLQHVRSYDENIRPLFESPSALRQSLQDLRLGTDMAGSQTRCGWSPPPDIKLDGISIGWKGANGERQLYGRLMRERGFDEDAIPHGW